MEPRQFNIQKPNTQYSFKIETYKGYTSNTIIINSKTVFYVKPYTDGGDDDNYGTTWGTAFETISKALEAAKAIAPSETNLVEIWVAGGNYEISTAMKMIKFVSIYGSFAGHEITKKQRTYLTYNTKLNPTTNIINKGTSTSNSRHFTTSLTQATAITPDSVTIDGICFKTAKASSIYNKYVSPTFSNCVWQNNSGTGPAGAVYNLYSSPNFNNCQFLNNTAGTMGGAIMYDTDITNDTAKSIIDNCVFYNNSSNQDGSAIYANTNNKIKITNSIIDTNITVNDRFGGSVFINDKATVEISNSYIVYNNATDTTYCGTGVRLKGKATSNSATLVANGVTFYQNTSSIQEPYNKIDIGRDVYAPTNTKDPTNNANRPTIQLTKCKLVGGNIISKYPNWFNSITSSITNVSTTINKSDIDANRAEKKIDESYL